MFKNVVLFYIRSKLEYCSVIWNSYFNNHIANVEAIKKKSNIYHSKSIVFIHKGVVTLPVVIR